MGDRLEGGQTLLTLRQENIDEPFSVVSEKAREMFRRRLIYAHADLHTRTSVLALFHTAGTLLILDCKGKTTASQPCNYNKNCTLEKRETSGGMAL